MSGAVMSGTFLNVLLDSLHNRPGFHLSFLTFACELDLVKGDESMMNAPCSAEIIESVFKLRKSKFLLVVNNAS